MRRQRDRDRSRRVLVTAPLPPWQGYVEFVANPPPSGPVVVSYLLQEDGFYLLQEDGSKLVLT